MAVHFNVATMFLPTETFFDDVSWWSGQFMYNVVASYFFPQQWIQINPIYCENKEHRLESVSGQASGGASKTYRRVISFERPLMWLISSFKLTGIKLATPHHASPLLYFLILCNSQGLDLKIQFQYWQLLPRATALPRLPCRQVWHFFHSHYRTRRLLPQVQCVPQRAPNSQMKLCRRYWETHALVLREYDGQVSYVNCRVDKQGEVKAAAFAVL